MATTAAPAYAMIDPGKAFDLDIERASMFIGMAREWTPGSAGREVERNGMGWRILRAYHGLRHP
ncbi:hypothetical protein ACFFGR_08730 [Arthrobacter liuii]|uniref:hypothetical protein n=1 Tax=Arthrobacter liuii TaxID=1476996 RepID=UPI00166473F5|nr:hypothetical protein [Arthrobacter liuii]